MKFVAATWILFVGALFAQPEIHSIGYLKNHPDEWPKDLILTSSTTFPIEVNGQASGTATMPAQTPVHLIAISETGLDVEINGNRTQIPAGQTDLWQRVEQFRTAKDLVARNDPACKLQLPINSAPKAWYESQIQTLIDPWLVANPSSSLYDQISALRGSFAGESERVYLGQIRRGDHWYSASEVAEKKATFDLEDLELQLASQDPATLLGAINGLREFSLAANHPKLLRQAIGSIDTILSANAASLDTVWKDKLSGLRQTLTSQAATEEEVLRKIDQVGPKLDNEDWNFAYPLLSQVEKQWPGNDALYKLCLDQTAASLQKYQSAVEHSDIPHAIRLYQLALSLIQVTAISKPLPENVIRSVNDLTDDVTLASSVFESYQIKDFDKVLSVRFDSLPAGFKTWGTNLQHSILEPREKSDLSLSAAKKAAMHLEWAEAVASFQTAQSFWPNNPEIVRDVKMIHILKIIAVILGVILLLLTPFFWSVARTMVFCYLPFRPTRKVEPI